MILMFLILCESLMPTWSIGHDSTLEAGNYTITRSIQFKPRFTADGVWLCRSSCGRWRSFFIWAVFGEILIEKFYTKDRSHPESKLLHSHPQLLSLHVTCQLSAKRGSAMITLTWRPAETIAVCLHPCPCDACVFLWSSEADPDTFLSV